MSGSVVNVLAEARSEGLERSFVLSRTAELAALNDGSRVNTVAPNLLDSALSYKGADADEFLASLNVHDPVVRPRPTLDEVAAAVFFIASEPLSGVTLGADDILPLQRR
jgi:NAD(P)-dependent dehydrogenase (short-subunit alcohol dehydrogenase family)